MKLKTIYLNVIKKLFDKHIPVQTSNFGVFTMVLSKAVKQILEYVSICQEPSKLNLKII